jgi:hypothetical protein
VLLYVLMEDFECWRGSGDCADLVRVIYPLTGDLGVFDLSGDKMQPRRGATYLYIIISNVSLAIESE